MARQIKKLKIENILPIEKNQTHFDSLDSTLAKEHYGYYLIAKLSDKQLHRNSRLYLSYKHKCDYFKEKSKQCLAGYSKKNKVGKAELYEKDSKYHSLIKDFINCKFQESINLERTRNILIGFGLYIDYLNKYSILKITISEIKQSEVIAIYDYYNNQESTTIQNLKNLSAFISSLGILSQSVKKIIGTAKKTKTKDVSISSSILYQLEYFAKKEIKLTMMEVNKYWAWKKSFEEPDFITKENLLKTIFDYLDNRISYKKTQYIELLLIKLNNDFDIDASVLFLSSNKKKLAYNDIKIKKLYNISKNAKNINIKNDMYYTYWQFELFPSFPFSKVINSKYKDYNDGDFQKIRTWLNDYFSIKANVIEQRIFPKITDIYPLYLLILISTGINQEVLKDWRVIKVNNQYTLKADNFNLFTIIDGVKYRSNSTISTTLKNDSFEKEAIDFYIKWITPIYEKSNNDKLFQYLNIEGTNKDILKEVDNTFIAILQKNSQNLLMKYKILDINCNRIYSINHLGIRKAHNYQDYLRGKTEFERQLKKNHKLLDTTKIYYELQNHEWKNSKKYKIALAQNLVVGIFRGEIMRGEHKTADLFFGPISDCKNNKLPTFDNSPSLKENQVCSDWTKCLTLCEQSYVIPNVHGAVIFAWINYMERQKNEFLSLKDWEKEYLIDSQAAQDTIKHFTKSEIEMSKKESYKHDRFVKIKFKKMIKLKGNKIA